MTRRFYSQEAEQAVVARVLIRPEQLDEAMGMVAPNDFYDQTFRFLFSCMCEMAISGTQIDAVMLYEYTVSKGGAVDLGWLCDLAMNTPAGQVKGYCTTIKEHSEYRALMDEIVDMSATYPETAQNASQLISDAQNRLLGLSSSKSSEKRSALDMLRSSVDRLDKVATGAVDPMGIPYGIAEIDKMTMGAHSSQMIVMAGRPGDGKTNAGIKIIREAVFRKRKAAMFFSLEMEGEKIVNRILGAENNIDGSFFKNPEIGNVDCFEKIGAFATAYRNELEERLLIHDDASLTPSQIRARCIAAKRVHGDDLGVIVIDYLQLITPDKPTDNRANDVGAMSRFMKKMAMELGVPVVVLSQLNRSQSGRASKDARPRVTDLRESGAIEQDADVIILLFRAELINRTPENVGVAEWIIGKQREGETGIVAVSAAFQYSDFRELPTHRLAEYQGNGLSNNPSDSGAVDF